jgi:hypothetical protein
MWGSLDHRNPPTQIASQAIEAEKLLEALPRNKGREDLRVSLSEVYGHQFVSLRVRGA